MEQTKHPSSKRYPLEIRERAVALVRSAVVVKAFETGLHRFVCMSTSGLGSLIHAALGSFGGAGGLPKRSGCAA